MKNNDYGIVYLLVNECMPGIVKIGMTNRKELQLRMDELYTTGVPLPFQCVYACRVPVDQTAALEQALHAAFESHRVNPKREFFRVSPEQVMPILKWANCPDFTEELTEELNKQVSAEEMAAVKKAQRHRPALNFVEMQFKIGDELVYRDDNSIRVTIISEKKVEFQGEEWALSALTKSLRNLPYYVAPGQYWFTTDGRNLGDIYDETYPFGSAD